MTILPIVPAALSFAMLSIACTPHANSPEAPPAETASPPAPAAAEVPASPAASADPSSSAAGANTAAAERQVNGKPASAADSTDIKAAVEKAGWKSEGFTYGGTVGSLEQYGVAASRDGKKVAIGFTRSAKTPNEPPAFAKNYDRKTLYKLAAVSKDAPLLHSIDDDKHEVFFWVVLDKGASATDAKALFDGTFTAAK